MPSCPVCNRNVVRLANHLRKVHQLYYKTTEPTTMKQFIQWLKLIPMTPHDWEYIQRHRKELDRFSTHDQALSSKLFQMVYTNMEKYKNMKGSKLVILENTLQRAKAQSKHENINDQTQSETIIKSEKNSKIQANFDQKNPTVVKKRKLEFQNWKVDQRTVQGDDTSIPNSKINQ